MTSKTHKIVFSFQNPDSNIEIRIPAILSEENLINIVNIMNEKQLGGNPIDISKILKNTEIDTKE